MADNSDSRGGIWVSRVCTNLNHWEMEKMLRLLNHLEESRPDLSARDGWEWVISRIGKFSTQSLYGRLEALKAQVFSCFPTEVHLALEHSLKSYIRFVECLSR